MAAAGAAVGPLPRPGWELRNPGRLDWELAWFERAGIPAEVDPAAAAHHVLKLRVDFPLTDRAIPLEATYPDGFPRMRPSVRLRPEYGTFPVRHCSPANGDLCLLGRDTAQWTPQLSLYQLLASQLSDALTGAGTEDPQGEPAEFWWNANSLPDSYVLVDSAWDVGTSTEGTMEISAVPKGGNPISFQGVVTSVVGDGAELAQWQGRIPSPLERAKAFRIPWVKLEKEILPSNPLEDTNDLYSKVDWRANLGSINTTSLSAKMMCVIYPTELQWKQKGWAYLFLIFSGSKREYRQGIEFVSRMVVRTLRGGPTDMSARFSHRADLAEKSIALLGTGSIGAPVAVEMAKAGAGRISVIDNDVVEPGNSTRWPLGVSAWGRRKVQALADFVRDEYPTCHMRPIEFSIGQTSDDLTASDDKLVEPAIADADVTIDCTAEFGVLSLASDYCRIHGKPLVTGFATPSLEGGAVALFVPKGGCPTCLEHHFHQSTIAPPVGYGTETPLQQPPGCSQRTFHGASFDLQELSCEVTRMAVGVLLGERPVDRSVVKVLQLKGEGGRMGPQWTEHEFEKHAGCGCH